MTYLDILNRMPVLGDALQLPLSAKVKAETLLLRAHYAKGIKEWQTVLEQINKDTQPEDGGERNEEQQKTYDEAITEKLKEEVSLADRRFSSSAFEALCEAVGDSKEIVSSLNRNKEGLPQPFPAIVWLEYVADNLVAE